MRSEKGPCSRVTWLWYSSMGLIRRLPNSSSCAYGPKTEAEQNAGLRTFGMGRHFVCLRPLKLNCSLGYMAGRRGNCNIYVRLWFGHQYLRIGDQDIGMAQIHLG